MRRRRVGIGVGVLVVALVASVALTVAGFVPGTVDAVRDSVAPMLLVDGVPVPYDRPQAWTEASVVSLQSKKLTVFATGSTDSGGGPCGPPVLRFHVTENRQAVRVLVAGYRAPSTLAQACPAVGYLPGPHTLRLERGVGSRRVIDESTGRPVHLLDGARHPILPHAPGDLRAQPLTGWTETGVVSRRWVDPGSEQVPAITLTDQRPVSVRTSGPYGRVVQQVEVRGTPATVYKGVGTFPGTWFVQWTPNDDQTITLRVATAGTHRWSAASALALARTVTDYRTERTGRLGAPSVVGTVAATYNSADGPLRGAENLLKSSGVFVAVDCLGTGPLTVTIRGRAHPFTCTSTLTQHAFQSVGSPEDALRVSVDAPERVHWALSLARQFLDGS